MPLILEEDLQKLKSALSIIFSVINNVAADKDEVQRARAITYGNDLTAPKENSQMLIDVKGACISKVPRKDGRFQGYCKIAGQKVFCYGKTKEEVKQKIADILQKGVLPKKKKKRTVFKLSAWIEKWIELYKAPNVKPSTLQNIRDVIKPAAAALGEKDLTAITTEDLQKLFVSFSSERTRDLCRTYLDQLFKKAELLGMIKKNPCLAVEVKKHKTAHREALTRQQQADFLKAIETQPLRPLFVFLLQTGLRIGEALALTHEDIDREKKTVSVNKDVVFIAGKRIEQDTPKSAAGVRSVPIPDEALTLIAKANGTEKSVFLFTYDYVRSALRRISLSLGFNVSAHILRHTYATRLEEAGVSSKVKQYLLGHSTSRMTQDVYTHIQSDFINEKAEQIRSAFGE